MRKVILLLVFGLAVGVAQTGFAQDRDDQAKPAAPQKPAPATAPTPTPAAKEEREPIKTGPPKMTNVQVEITITDQIGSGAPTKKTVSLITSDGTVGRIRSRADTRAAGMPIPVNLNIDAFPKVVGDQVVLSLTIEYNPLKTAEEGGTGPAVTPTQLNQQLSIVMTSGKSMIVSQAADPVTDRKIVAEAKVTILK